jgi:hypothetical protein
MTKTTRNRTRRSCWRRSIRCSASATTQPRNYIQHSAHIEPGRDSLFKLIRRAPDALRYEHQLIVVEGDYVIVHGRFTGNGRPVAWIAADMLRIEDSRLEQRRFTSSEAGASASVCPAWPALLRTTAASGLKF